MWFEGYLRLVGGWFSGRKFVDWDMGKNIKLHIIKFLSGGCFGVAIAEIYYNGLENINDITILLALSAILYAVAPKEVK